MPSGDGLIEHTPEDMTITAEAGMTLCRLQEILAAHHQWLPLDPAFPEALTLVDLVIDRAPMVEASKREIDGITRVTFCGDMTGTKGPNIKHRHTGGLAKKRSGV